MAEVRHDWPPRLMNKQGHPSWNSCFTNVVVQTFLAVPSFWTYLESSRCTNDVERLPASYRPILLELKAKLMALPRRAQFSMFGSGGGDSNYGVQLGARESGSTGTGDAARLLNMVLENIHACACRRTCVFVSCKAADTFHFRTLVPRTKAYLDSFPTHDENGFKLPRPVQQIDAPSLYIEPGLLKDTLSMPDASFVDVIWSAMDEARRSTDPRASVASYHLPAICAMELQLAVAGGSCQLSAAYRYNAFPMVFVAPRVCTVDGGYPPGTLVDVYGLRAVILSSGAGDMSHYVCFVQLAGVWWFVNDTFSRTLGAEESFVACPEAQRYTPVVWVYERGDVAYAPRQVVVASPALYADMVQLSAGSTSLELGQSTLPVTSQALLVALATAGSRAASPDLGDLGPPMSGKVLLGGGVVVQPSEVSPVELSRDSSGLGSGTPDGGSPGVMPAPAGDGGWQKQRVRVSARQRAQGPRAHSLQPSVSSSGVALSASGAELTCPLCSKFCTSTAGVFKHLNASVHDGDRPRVLDTWLADNGSRMRCGACSRFYVCASAGVVAKHACMAPVPALHGVQHASEESNVGDAIDETLGLMPPASPSLDVDVPALDPAIRSEPGMGLSSGVESAMLGLRISDSQTPVVPPVVVVTALPNEGGDQSGVALPGQREADVAPSDAAPSRGPLAPPLSPPLPLPCGAAEEGNAREGQGVGGMGRGGPVTVARGLRGGGGYGRRGFRGRGRGASPRLSPVLQQGRRWVCPFPGCARGGNGGFEYSVALVQHLNQVHGGGVASASGALQRAAREAALAWCATCARVVEPGTRHAVAGCTLPPQHVHTAHSGSAAAGGGGGVGGRGSVSGPGLLSRAQSGPPAVGGRGFASVPGRSAQSGPAAPGGGGAASGSVSGSVEWDMSVLDTITWDAVKEMDFNTVERPVRLWAWQKAVARIVQRIMVGVLQGSGVDKPRFWKLLLLLPRWLLQPRFTPKGGQGTWRIRTNAFMAGKFLYLHETSKNSAAPPPLSRGQRPSSNVVDGASGDVADDGCDLAACAPPVVASHSQGPLHEEASSAASIKRVERLTSLGELSRAMHALISDLRVSSLTGDKEEKLRELHPQRSQQLPAWNPVVPPVVVVNGPGAGTLRGVQGPVAIAEGYPVPNAEVGFVPASFAVEWRDLHRVLRKMAKGSAGGPSRWRLEHVQMVLAHSAPGLFVRLMQAVMDGAVPEEVKPVLYGAALTPLDKPDGGIRPIAVGEVFVRIVGKLLAAQFRGLLAAFFDKRGQLGVAISNGSEAAVWAVRRILELHPDWVLFKGDIRNAFNSVSRALILRKLQQHSQFAPLIPYFMANYNLPSDLVYRNTAGGTSLIKSNEGVRQGDPLGPFFFALAFDEVLSPLVSEFSDNAVLGAFLDDFFFVAPPGLVPRIAEAWARNMHDSGSNLQIAPNKQECFSFQADVTVFRQHGWKCDAQGGTKLLGCPVGTLAFERDFWRQETQSVLQAITRLDDVRFKQSRMLLLRYCAVSRANFMLRGSAPDATLESAGLFDQGIMLRLAGLVGLPVDSIPVLDVVLPLRLGCLGLSSAVLNCDPAFLGVVNDTAMVMQRFFPCLPVLRLEVEVLAPVPLLREPVGGALETSAVGGALETSAPGAPGQAAVGVGGASSQQSAEGAREPSVSGAVAQGGERVHGVDALVSRTAEQVVATFQRLQGVLLASSAEDVPVSPSDIGSLPHGLQKRLAEAVTSARAHDLSQHECSLARRLSQAQQGAAAVWRAIPSEEGLRLSNPVFTTAVRQWLGLTVLAPDSANLRCACADHPLLTDVHIMSCGVAGAVTVRHDAIVRVVAEMFDAAGFSCTVEPSGFQGLDPEAGPDLDVYDFNGATTGVCFDVTVVNPQADSNAHRAATRALSTASAAELGKVNKYRASMALNHRGIAGIAMEATGAFGPGWQRMLRTCHARYEQSGGVTPFARYGDTWTTVSFRDYWAQRFAVQLRRGNNLVVTRLQQVARSVASRALI